MADGGAWWLRRLAVRWTDPRGGNPWLSSWWVIATYGFIGSTTLTNALHAGRRHPALAVL